MAIVFNIVSLKQPLDLAPCWLFHQPIWGKGGEAGNDEQCPLVLFTMAAIHPGKRQQDQ